MTELADKITIFFTLISTSVVRLKTEQKNVTGTCQRSIKSHTHKWVQFLAEFPHVMKKEIQPLYIHLYISAPFLFLPLS